MALSRRNMPTTFAESFFLEEKMIDFTHCPCVMSKAYNGANGKKIAVR